MFPSCKGKNYNIQFIIFKIICGLRTEFEISKILEETVWITRISLPRPPSPATPWCTRCSRPCRTPGWRRRPPRRCPGAWPAPPSPPGRTRGRCPWRICRACWRVVKVKSLKFRGVGGRGELSNSKGKLMWMVGGMRSRDDYRDSPT